MCACDRVRKRASAHALACVSVQAAVAIAECSSSWPHGASGLNSRSGHEQPLYTWQPASKETLARCHTPNTIGPAPAQRGADM